MDYVIHPLEGVGELKFGMTREQVHSVIGKPEKQLKWTAGATDMTDIYVKDGIGVHYDKGDSMSMIEFAGPVSPSYGNIELLNVKDPSAWLESQDDEADIEPPDLTSEVLGISFYVPERGPKSVGVFRKGYYD